MPRPLLTVRPIAPPDLPATHNLTMRAFDNAIAPDYTPQGREAFAAYAAQDALRQRLADNHVTLVAEAHGHLAGVVEVRGHTHVSMLFVDPTHQRTGIGRTLLDAAIGLCAARDPPPTAITVNSAPSAVAFYERNGFTITGPTATKHGIVAVPMAHAL